MLHSFTMLVPENLECMFLYQLVTESPKSSKVCFTLEFKLWTRNHFLSITLKVQAYFLSSVCFVNLKLSGALLWALKTCQHGDENRDFSNSCWICWKYCSVKVNAASDLQKIFSINYEKALILFVLVAFLQIGQKYIK